MSQIPARWRQMHTDKMPEFFTEQFGFDDTTAAQILGLSPLLYKRLVTSKGKMPLRVEAMLSCLLLAQSEAPSVVEKYVCPTISPDAFLVELREVWPELSMDQFAHIVGRTVSSAYRWGSRPTTSTRSFRMLVGVIRDLLGSVDKDKQVSLLERLSESGKI